MPSSGMPPRILGQRKRMQRTQSGSVPILSEEPSKGEGVAQAGWRSQGHSKDRAFPRSKLGSRAVGRYGLACCGRIPSRCSRMLLGRLVELEGPAGGSCSHQGRPGGGGGSRQSWRGAPLGMWGQRTSSVSCWLRPRQGLGEGHGWLQVFGLGYGRTVASPPAERVGLGWNRF